MEVISSFLTFVLIGMLLLITIEYIVDKIYTTVKSSNIHKHLSNHKDKIQFRMLTDRDVFTTADFMSVIGYARYSDLVRNGCDLFNVCLDNPYFYDDHKFHLYYANNGYLCAKVLYRGRIVSMSKKHVDKCKKIIDEQFTIWKLSN